MPLTLLILLLFECMLVARAIYYARLRVKQRLIEGQSMLGTRCSYAAILIHWLRLLESFYKYLSSDYLFLLLLFLFFSTQALVLFTVFLLLVESTNKYRKRSFISQQVTSRPNPAKFLSIYNPYMDRQFIYDRCSKSCDIYQKTQFH